jgi:serine protease Do
MQGIQAQAAVGKNRTRGYECYCSLEEKHMCSGLAWWTRILVAALAAMTVSGCQRRFPNPGEPIARTAGTLAAPISNPARSTTDRDLPDFSALVESRGPAVVNVAVIQQAATGRGGAPGPQEEDPLSEFFRRFGIPLPNEEEPRGPIRGMGSGFIVSPDGYVLTNAHVVSEAAEVTVKLTDRREFPAKVVGVDLRSDVAVLKIEARNLPVVQLGDPARVKPGQWVVAIGSPFGFENSVTVGVVSGTARSLPGGGYIPFIQTDVAVNPGNSGGPLFNLQGEVVGINSQIVSRSGGYMGISFAIPIDVARDVQEQLIRTGRVVRGRIGVAVQDVNAQLAESFGLDRPADKAGLKPGDVILEVNGSRIEHSSELSTRVARVTPGSTATLTLWRNHSMIETRVSVGEIKEARRPLRVSGGGEASGQIGWSVRPLTSEERQAMQTEGGLVITNASGAAALAGVQAGDIVLAVNGTPVKTLRELRAALEKPAKVAALLIQREQAQIFIPIPLEGAKR